MTNHGDAFDELVDQRDPGFYIVDDEVVDEYGAKIGPLGVAVYNVLVRHANKHGTSCFPSYQTIADKLGISRNNAIKGVALLLEHKLVVKQPRTDKFGAPTSNLYRIRAIKKRPKEAKEVVQNLHHPPESLSDAGSANSALPSANDALPLVQNLHQGSANSAPEPDPINQTQLNQTPSLSQSRPPPRVDAPASTEGERRSRFTRAERLAYYRNKPGVVEPEALANAKWVRAGDADEEIAAWYESGKPVGQSDARDVSGCPDCTGTGMWYPDGFGKGAARCKHPKLEAAAETATR